jgi:signal recognition particle receptor subunit beta
MPVVNPLARELVFKIVYYGPGLGGKTTTLQYIHANTKAEHRGKMVSLATPVDRTLYFDFLPIRVPNVRGLAVRLQLFTVPGQVYYNATRKLVLTGADGVVLVVDSQRARFDANLESLDNLRDNLREHGRSLEEIPHVIQHNKRDLGDVVPVEELEPKLNRYGVPSFATVATRGDGVFEALEAIARTVLDDFERRMPEQRRAAGQALELPEEGLAEALRRADSSGARPVVAPTRAAAEEQVELAVAAGAEPGVTPANADRSARREATPPSPGVAPAPYRPRAETFPGPVGAPDEPPGSELSREVASFSVLWPAAEQDTVRELETALARTEFESAVALADQLVSRVLASAATLLGSTADAPRDPATVAMLLGLDGPRYLRFRALVRESRSGRAISANEALAAYAFVIQARLSRNEL